MNIITLLAYTISIIFLIILTRAILRVIRDNRYKKNVRKRSDAIKANDREYRKQGLRPFRFDQGKVVLYARSFKEANKQYQTNRNNGMYNL